MEKMGLTVRKVNPSFWQGKRVFLTGHTGFKGSWMSLWLQSMGAVVRGVALTPPTMPALFNVARVADGMDHLIADIRDYEKTLSIMSEFRPEIVIHMAAQPLVRLSYQQPIETFETNVMGTVHVLEAARRVGSVRAIVNITTDKCYENNEWMWSYRENEPMGGHDPYSSSKGCAELVSSAYRKSFLMKEDIALATARAGNVIGGGDWALDRLVPDTLRALESQQSVIIRNPNSIRPWQHVLEPLAGYLMLAENLYQNGQIDAEGWNFGPREDEAKPVHWIVEYLCEVWGQSANWTLQSGEQVHEAHFLKLDISKARHRLDWEPKWTLPTALSLIISWHKAWIENLNMQDICLSQISHYQN